MAKLFAKINKQFVLLTAMIQTHINKLQKKSKNFLKFNKLLQLLQLQQLLLFHKI